MPRDKHDAHTLPDGTLAELTDALAGLAREGLRFATVFVVGVKGALEDELAKFTKGGDDADR